MVLDPIPQILPVHFFGSRPQPPTSPACLNLFVQVYMHVFVCVQVYVYACESRYVDLCTCKVCGVNIARLKKNGEHLKKQKNVLQCVAVCCSVLQCVAVC